MSLDQDLSSTSSAIKPFGPFPRMREGSHSHSPSPSCCFRQLNDWPFEIISHISQYWISRSLSDLSSILVGGFNHIEKYEFVNGKDDNPYIIESPNHQPVFVMWKNIIQHDFQDSGLGPWLLRWIPAGPIRHVWQSRRFVFHGFPWFSIIFFRLTHVDDA